ncbi:ComEC family competence protein [Echinicola marina]|uniref:ComEC/Rec2 family competence protein n=1 Tax=Echinicola marina TaxID=2859768 RepID=UPI001CF6C30C|nr:ComEC/Rec2 family competence protein [Echinicola marina]UCS93760.1 ComEC family competence protein [Echinicola marina]
MKFNEFPFLRYFAFIALGILSYPHFHFFNNEALIWGIVLLLLLYFTLAIGQLSKRGFAYKWCYPVLAYFMLMLSGYYLAYQADERNEPNHLMGFQEVEGYMAVVLSSDREKSNSIANKVAVKTVKTPRGYFEASGQVMIYHRLDSVLHIGDVLWLQGKPEKLAPPSNPKEFDYRGFLANKQIYHSQFVGKSLSVLGKVNEQPIYSWISNIRDNAMIVIDREIKDGQVAQVLKAFLLGEKQDLDEALSDAYVKAGTMHILAVSGLHVGMIYGFFFLFFKPVQSSQGKRLVILSVIVLLIWAYALLTGLSPSVMRAASMFTILSLAQVMSRSPSIINSLALSAVVLLVLQPFIIYEVGFQLSYAAVLGIVVLQPRIRRLWLPKNKLLYYLWEISSVSIAAQLATFPISAYYFHVFPNYGLLANLWAIPGAFLIMALGLPYLLLLIFDFSFPLLTGLLEGVVRVLNYLIFSIQDLPFAQTEGIYIDLAGMLLFWLGVVCVFYVYEYRRKTYAFVFFIVCFLGIAQYYMKWFLKAQKNELYVYCLREGMAMDYFNKGKLYKINWNLPSKEKEFKVEPHRAYLVNQAVFELKSEGQGDQRRVYLPDGKSLLINKGVLDLSTLPVGELSFFEEGGWKVLAKRDNLKLGESAYKIILGTGN